MRCRCGSSKVETEASSGTTFCVACGEVLEENTIVAEVTFQELSGGKTVLSGSFAGESGRIASSGPFGRGRGREGQEQAMENGRLKIAHMAHAINLPERYREAAQRYYNLAVVNRFTRGRRSEHVAAVCLYIVCRDEKSSQMLIDFSDVLQVNVFVLGSTFLKLVRTLNLRLPLIDPSIYISRFAAALDFGEYTQRVAQDAVRLVQRMDRDWIRTGRRPSGICGACLLIAARMNGFRRTTREMIYVVRVAEITIHARLKEFAQTESARLSVRDFRTMWLEKEADPPSFIRARAETPKKKKKRFGGILLDDIETDYEDNDEDDEDQQIPRRQPTVVAASPMTAPMTPMTAPGSPAMTSSPPAATATTPMAAPEDTQATLVPDSQVPDDTQATMVNPSLEEQVEELEKEVEGWMKTADFVENSEAFATERKEKIAQEEEDSRLSDVDDEEIEAMLLTPEEVRLKTMIWYTENKEYLAEMKARAEKLAMDRQNGVISKKGKHARKRKLPAAESPAEAAKQLVQTRKFSKKINQDVFDGMFESPESIEKIKELDKLKEVMRSAGIDENTGDYSAYEVVEESGDALATKKQKTGDDGKATEAVDQEDEDEDDEDMDPEDMADDERLMMEGRRAMGWADDADEDDYYDYD
ncbi:hypothetical protein O0I10_000647 [Lichtheimia ornata]|uniref:B-related factor 1 n=1 Tax=Lichtheimia ornata TaxID=688661 RepID=A0AAD8DJ05_9FUNG|nr:uncharacterized protein O0I10_000647 [Lichtheimia ornata]KAJ8663408.1 hypothetical protein O0I10_000647 [Lichtheimia ornata]